jgi:serine/threonine-protein kinase
VDEGDAIRTNPPGGTQAEVGSRVLLFVSTGPRQVEVPDVVDLARESAEATLNRAGLGFTVNEQESDEEPGTVIAQDPARGQLARGGTVRLTVAVEASQISVPDVVGRSQNLATKLLSGRGFEVAVEEVEVDSPDGDGIVQEQEPAGAGAKADRGSTVTITVGRFDPTVDPEPGTETTPQPATTTTTPAP